MQQHLTIATMGIKAPPLALRARTSAGDSGWRERVRCPRAKGSSPLLPGGSDIMSAGIMTGMRGARWNRGERRRDTPAIDRRLLRETWSGLHFGMRESQGKSRRGTPTGERALQGARLPQGKRLRTASVGVLLPFIL